MTISRQKKEEIYADLIDRVKKAKSVFLSKNLGLSVGNSESLRKTLRNEGNSLRVAKKTLIKKAIKEVYDISLSDDILDGAVSAAFSNEDEISAIKTLAKFAKETEKIELVGGVFEGKELTASDAIALSKIPGREELLAKLLGSMQAPLSGFVGVGNQVVSGFVRVVDGYREQKEAS